MDQIEQAIIEALRSIPPKQREAILQVVHTLVRELTQAAPTDSHARYSRERHQAVRRLTATVEGSLAAAISAERSERG